VEVNHLKEVAEEVVQVLEVAVGAFAFFSKLISHQFSPRGVLLLEKRKTN
jgi:uncharacterized protein YllA (UPF0747 family)